MPATYNNNVIRVTGDETPLALEGLNGVTRSGKDIIVDGSTQLRVEGTFRLDPDIATLRMLHGVNESVRIVVDGNNAHLIIGWRVDAGGGNYIYAKGTALVIENRSDNKGSHSETARFGGIAFDGADTTTPAATFYGATIMSGRSISFLGAQSSTNIGIGNNRTSGTLIIEKTNIRFTNLIGQNQLRFDNHANATVNVKDINVSGISGINRILFATTYNSFSAEIQRATIQTFYYQPNYLKLDDMRFLTNTATDDVYINGGSQTMELMNSDKGSSSNIGYLTNSGSGVAVFTASLKIKFENIEGFRIWSRDNNNGRQNAIGIGVPANLKTLMENPDRNIYTVISNQDGEAIIERIVLATRYQQARNKTERQYVDPDDYLTWRCRHYGYQPLEVATQLRVVGGAEFDLEPVPDDAILLPEATAVNIQGVAIDPSAQTITINSPISIRDLYDYSKAWWCDLANFEVENQPISAVISDGKISITTDYDIEINSTLAKNADGDSLKTTGTITLNGTTDVDLVDQNGTFISITVNNIRFGYEVVVGEKTSTNERTLYDEDKLHIEDSTQSTAVYRFITNKDSRVFVVQVVPSLSDADRIKPFSKVIDITDQSIAVDVVYQPYAV